MNIMISTDKISPFKLLLVLSIVAILFVFGISKYGFSVVLMAGIVLVALPLAFCVIVYPKFGILVLLISSYLIMFTSRLGVNFPVGTLMDGLQLLLIIGFCITQKINPNWKILKNYTSLLVLIWVGYNLLQFFNITAESQLAWVYTIRSVAVVMLMYFVFLRQINSIEFIRLIIKVWIGLAFFAALYSFKQEHIGFFRFEEQWLASDPNLSTLYLIMGHWRKFSIFSDPVAFSYNMVTCSILCTVLILNVEKMYMKVILGALVIFFLVNMLYSGTRAAYVLYPAALFLFAILKLNYKVLIFSSIAFLFLVGLIFAPIYTPMIMRFQSAFRPSEDASFNVRKINQKRIQPYIQQHPFGGGLGSTGTWGERFSPDSYLAKFPPDSGYVRVAVETGWFGILLFCTLMFVILANGIRNYYRIHDPELKNYCLAMILVIFALNIGNYPQEAIVQFPHSVYFSLFVALLHVTYYLDRRKKLVNDNMK
ncbi:putative inorganic carbon (HCO3(-)) transporter [Pedobacter sp. UYP24]